jgi:hypothetical protein
MEHSEILAIWKTYDKKLEENLRLNRQQAQDIMKLKIKSQLDSMQPVKLFAIIVGLLWVGAGTFVLGNLAAGAFDKVSKFFFFSACIQLLLTAAAIIVYAYQLVLIRQVDISEPILQTQKRLAGLKSSTIQATRILFLQLPAWTTFYLSGQMFAGAGIGLYIIQGLITGAFTYAAIWLFIHIDYRNKDKKWFRLLFSGREWTPILRSMELYMELENFEEEKAAQANS